MIWDFLLGRAILIRPGSGLGNQLFLYSVGRYVEQRNGRRLYIDVSRLNSNKLSHGGNIQSFNLPGRFVSLGFSGKVLDWLLPRVIRSKFIQKVFGIFVADGVGYQSKLELQLQKVRFLEGFFMCDEYFSNTKNMDESEFELIHPSIWYETTKKEISVGFSIILHVRRGDFLANPDSWGILSEQYYLDALSFLKYHSESNMKLYVLSDNLELVKSEFLNPVWRGATFLNTFEKDPAEVLKLISFARVIILGNSTFSWWGSRIGKDASVVAPKPFYKSSPDFIDLERNDMHFVGSVWVQRTVGTC